MKRSLQIRLLGFFVVSLVLGPFTVSADVGMSLRNRIKIQKKSYLKRSKRKSDPGLTLEKIQLLEKKRRNQIFDIKRFLRESKDSLQKLNLTLDLGAIYMEDYYAKLDKAQRIYDKKYKRWEKKKKSKKRGPAPQLDTSEAIASLDRARKIYKDLLKRYSKFDRADELHYILAASALDKGNVKEAMGHFQTLSNKYPKSNHIGEALIELADYYFDTHQFAKAEKNYNRIIDRRDRGILSYAHYKRGWCAYNQGRPKQTLADFKWVIKNERDLVDTDRLDDRNTRMVRVKSEAMKDITLPFVDLKLLKESVQFFKPFKDPQKRKAYEMMAALYHESGNYQHANYLRSLLIKMDRNHPKNPEYELAIIDGYRRKNDSDGAIERLFQTLPSYLEGSSWYEINASRPKVLKKARNDYEDTARKFAFQLHAEAQKTKNKKLYTTAKALYSKYLEFFPNTPDATSIRFYFAEILFKQKMFLKAANEYYKVYQSPHAGNLKFNSILFALTSLDQQLNLDRKKAGLDRIDISRSKKRSKKDKQDDKFTEYTPVEGQFIKISGVFLKAYPKAKESPEILFERSYLQYDHRDYPRAFKGFWKFIRRYPAHEAGYTAANLVLDILNRKKDYPHLSRAAKHFLKIKEFKAPAFRQEVARVLRASELQIIASIERQQKFKEAGVKYLDYIQEYGIQDLALYEKALFNASVNFTKAELYVRAVETQERFLRRFPQSKLREQMYLNVAKTYEKLANFAKAAEYYDSFFQTYPNNPQAKSALRLAGLYYWGSGQTGKAELVMKGILKQYPRASETKLVKKDLLDMYQTEGALDRQIAFYSQERQRVPITDFLVYSLKMAELMTYKGGAPPKSFLQRLLRIGLKHEREVKRSERGRDSLAKLLFWNSKKKEARFYDIRLSLPESTLQRRLQQKLALLGELEADYKKISSIGNTEWALAGIYKTALVNRHIAEVVLHAPIPSKLNAQQIELYRNELKKSLINPFAEKAFNFAVQCLDKARELKLLTPWTSACYSLAGALKPKRYPVVRTLYLPPLQTALILPKRGESKIKRGKVTNYKLPFYSSALFLSRNKTREIATYGKVLPWQEDFSFQDDQEALYDTPNYVPQMMTYGLLSPKRLKALRKSARSLRPQNKKASPTFAYLNLKRLTDPKGALPLILTAIEREPDNIALHNLLALAHLESGNLSAAKVTWFSLLARGQKHPQIWNNLGVLASLEGKEDHAIGFFNEALKEGNIEQTHTNLGFLALKYQSGFKAKKHFQKARKRNKNDVTLKIALTVAKIQNGEADEARNDLIEYSKSYGSNPFSRLSAAFLLIDLEKEPLLAKKLLTDYVSRYSAERDILFRRVLAEASRKAMDSSLPTID